MELINSANSNLYCCTDLKLRRPILKCLPHFSYTVEVVKTAGLNFSAISILDHKSCCKFN